MNDYSPSKALVLTFQIVSILINAFMVFAGDNFFLRLLCLCGVAGLAGMIGWGISRENARPECKPTPSPSSTAFFDPNRGVSQ